MLEGSDEVEVEIEIEDDEPLLPPSTTTTVADTTTSSSTVASHNSAMGSSAMASNASHGIAVPTPSTINPDAESYTDVAVAHAFDPTSVGGGVRSQDGHILIITTGSRGDIQPFVALALGLLQRGFSCAIATHECFESFVRQETTGRVGFYPLVGNPASVLSSPELRDAFYENNKMAQLKLMMAEHEKMVVPNLHRGWQACLHAKPDLIIGAIVSQFDAISFGQRLGVPVITASTVPFWPTSEMPPIGVDGTPAFLNKVLSCGMCSVVLCSVV
jgi:hypothetical protein